MNKIKILLLFILTTSFCFADILPYYYGNLKNTAIGFVKVSSPLEIRSEPSSESEIIETIEFDYQNHFSCTSKQCIPEKIFSAYSEKNKIALLSATDESQNWIKVCFNSEKPLCGWVKEDKNKFYNWSDFYNHLGKKYGLYYFKDISKKDKILYASPQYNSNSTGKMILPRAIVPWLVRGNWVLVKVYDYDNNIKTGWINFRDENGKLKFFVKI